MPDRPQDEIARLEQLISQKQARLQKLKAARRSRNRSQSRKDDARRKIIAGALALTHMEENPASEFATTLHRLLNRYVVKPDERALLDLPPLNENQPGESAPAQASSTG